MLVHDRLTTAVGYFFVALSFSFSLVLCLVSFVTSDVSVFNSVSVRCKEPDACLLRDGTVEEACKTHISSIYA